MSIEQEDSNIELYRKKFESIINAAIDFGIQIEKYKPESTDEVRNHAVKLYSRTTESIINHQTIAIIRFCQANHTAQWFREVRPEYILREFYSRIEERDNIKEVPDHFRFRPLGKTDISQD